VGLSLEICVFDFVSVRRARYLGFHRAV